MASSKLDPGGVLKHAFDDATGTLKTGNGFLSSAVGRKVEVAYPTVTNETYTYKDGATTLYVITVTYTDSTKANISSVERTA